MPLLCISPETVDFGAQIFPNTLYEEQLKITNTLSSPVSFSLRCSAPARLSVAPAECAIEAGESITVYLKLNTQASAHKLSKPFRDTIFIHSAYFQQKVSVLFATSIIPPETRAPKISSQNLNTTTNHQLQSQSQSPPFHNDFEAKSEKAFRVLQLKDQIIEELTEKLSLATTRVDAVEAALEQSQHELKETHQKLEKKSEEYAELNNSKKSQSEAAPPPPIVDSAALDVANLQLSEQKDQIEVLVGEIARLQSFPDRHHASQAQERESITSKFKIYENSLRSLEESKLQLEKSLHTRCVAFQEIEALNLDLAAKHRLCLEGNQKMERELLRLDQENSRLRDDLRDREAEVDQEREIASDLRSRCACLEELQMVARETLSKSEARLREAVVGHGSTHSSDEADLVAIGEPTSTQGPVQLWWMELAQRLENQVSDGEGGSNNTQLKTQGLEIVHLRQELIARDLEMRRLKEDAESTQKGLKQRISSLERIVRTAGEEHRSRIFELEHTVTQLSSRSDLHMHLSDARQALASEQAKSLHRVAELESLQQLREAELKEHRELSIQIQALKRSLDQSSVASTLQGVAGVSPSALIHHFTGVSKLQADRIRQLGQVLSGGAQTHDAGVNLSSHWAQLEVHLLTKKNESLTAELVSIDARFKDQAKKHISMIEGLKQQLSQCKAESARTSEVLEQRAELAEGRAAVSAAHLKHEMEQTARFEKRSLELLSELGDQRKLENDVPSFEHFGGQPSNDDNTSASPSTLELESMLKERSAQVGILSDTIEALQVAIAASAAQQETKEEPAWALTSLKKRVVGLTVECSSALAQVGVQERRASHLLRCNQYIETKNTTNRRLIKQLQQNLEESEGAFLTAKDENLKQRQKLRSEVNAMMMAVEMQVLGLQSVEAEALRWKEEVENEKERSNMLERELKACKAKLVSKIDPTCDQKLLCRNVRSRLPTDDLMSKLIDTVGALCGDVKDSSKLADLIKHLDDAIRHCYDVADCEHNRAEAEVLVRLQCEEALVTCRRERELEVLKGERLREAFSRRNRMLNGIDTNWTSVLKDRIRVLYGRLDELTGELSDVAAQKSKLHQRATCMARRVALLEVPTPEVMQQTKNTDRSNESEFKLESLKKWFEDEISELILNDDMVSLTETLCSVKRDNLNLQKSLEHALLSSDSSTIETRQLHDKFFELRATHEMMLAQDDSAGTNSQENDENECAQQKRDLNELAKANFLLKEQNHEMEQKLVLVEEELEAVRVASDVDYLYQRAEKEIPTSTPLSSINPFELQTRKEEQEENLDKENENIQLRRELNIARRGNKSLTVALKELEMRKEDKHRGSAKNSKKAKSVKKPKPMADLLAEATTEAAHWQEKAQGLSHQLLVLKKKHAAMLSNVEEHQVELEPVLDSGASSDLREAMSTLSEGVSALREVRQQSETCRVTLNAAQQVERAAMEREELLKEIENLTSENIARATMLRTANQYIDELNKGKRTLLQRISDLQSALMNTSSYGETAQVSLDALTQLDSVLSTSGAEPLASVTFPQLLEKATLLKEDMKKYELLVDSSSRRANELEDELEAERERTSSLTADIEKCNRQLSSLQQVCDPEAELRALSASLESIKQKHQIHQAPKDSPDGDIMPPLNVEPASYPSFRSHEPGLVEQEDDKDRGARWATLRQIRSEFESVLGGLVVKESELLQSLHDKEKQMSLMEEKFRGELEEVTLKFAQEASHTLEVFTADKKSLNEEIDRAEKEIELKKNDWSNERITFVENIHHLEQTIADQTQQIVELKTEAIVFKSELASVSETLSQVKATHLEDSAKSEDLFHAANEKTALLNQQLSQLQSREIQLKDAVEQERINHSTCAKSIAEQFAQYKSASQSLLKQHEAIIRELRKKESQAKSDLGRYRHREDKEGKRKRSDGSFHHDVAMNTRFIDALSFRDEEIVKLKSQIHSLRVQKDTALAETTVLHSLLTGNSDQKSKTIKPVGEDLCAVEEHFVSINTTLSELKLSNAQTEVKSLRLSLEEERRERERVLSASLLASIANEENAAKPMKFQTENKDQNLQKSRIASLQASVSTMRSELVALREERADTVNMTRELSAMQKSLSTAREDVARKGRALSAAQASRTQLECDKRDLMEKLEALENKTKKLTLELARRKSTIETLQLNSGSSLNTVNQEVQNSLEARESQLLDTREELKVVSLERGRLRQQVSSLKIRIVEQEDALEQLEIDHNRMHALEEKVTSAVTALHQKETAIKVLKAKLQAVEVELNDVRVATDEWQQEAEKRIRMGQRRVCLAETRASQVEINANMGKVNLEERETKLVEAKNHAVDELQALRSAVQSIVSNLYNSKERAMGRAKLQQSCDETSKDLIGTGYIASLLDLNPEELDSIMSSEGSITHPRTNDSTEFQFELTQILEAPVDVEALRRLVLSLVEERVNAENQEDMRSLST